MIITILDWIGTVFILLGNYIITSERSFNRPKIKLIAIIFYLISNIVWIPFAILLGVEGLLMTQILLMIMNVRGVRGLLIKLKKRNDKEV